MNSIINFMNHNKTMKKCLEDISIPAAAQVWAEHANFMKSVLIDNSYETWYDEMIKFNRIYDC